MSTEASTESENAAEPVAASEKLVWTEPQLKFFKPGMAENNPGANFDFAEAARS
jgi:hypothetical protein